MTFIRRNVWELGSDWADDVLWYARGVAAMKARALAEPTSWRFYAGMHGFNSARWHALGYLFPTDHPPSQAQLSTFWNQCQHGSWYFLPWHRGYVLALEANIRARGRRAQRPGRLGAALLELLRAERGGAPSGLRRAGLAGRRGR